jgi:hypothetical protein
VWATAKKLPHGKGDHTHRRFSHTPQQFGQLEGPPASTQQACVVVPVPVQHRPSARLSRTRQGSRPPKQHKKGQASRFGPIGTAVPCLEPHHLPISICSAFGSAFALHLSSRNCNATATAPICPPTRGRHRRCFFRETPALRFHLSLDRLRCQALCCPSSREARRLQQTLRRSQCDSMPKWCWARRCHGYLQLHAGHACCPYGAQ